MASHMVAVDVLAGWGEGAPLVLLGWAEAASSGATILALAATVGGITWAVRSFRSMGEGPPNIPPLDADAINAYFDARERDSAIDLMESPRPEDEHR